MTDACENITFPQLLLWTVKTIAPIFCQGNCAENIASVMNISREAQDEYAIGSYEKSQAASKEGIFQEIVPVTIKKKKGKITVTSKCE